MGAQTGEDVYGNDYAETHPEAVALKQQIYKIFKAKTKKTVNKRYRQVMSLKEAYVAHMPEVQRIFDFLERHRLAPTGLPQAGQCCAEPAHSAD